MKNRPVHFEIQADDCERAIKFYSDVFGWNFQKWEGSPTEYYMIMTAEKDSKEQGINGGLLKRPCPAPAPEQGTNAFVCTMLVENYGESEQKVLKAGGKVAMPKFALPGMAWQGYYIDLEGNTFGLHQADPNAK
jgi:hypothetical protein